MSIFALKIIACISMFLDHIKYASPIFINPVTQYLGRIAFPLYAFMIAEGYSHTKDIKKYYIRLIVFAIVSQIPFMLFISLFRDIYRLNVIFTLILGLTCIYTYEKIDNKLISLSICVVLIATGTYIKADYRMVWSRISISLSSMQK